MGYYKQEEIIAKDNGYEDAEYERHPLGTFSFCCVGAHLKKHVKVTFKDETKFVDQVWFVFESKHRDSENNPYFFHIWGLTLSLSPKATLRRVLKQWLGIKDFSKEDLEKGFKAHKMVGRMCLADIVESKKIEDGKEKIYHVLDRDSIAKFKPRIIDDSDNELKFEKFEPSGNKYPEWLEKLIGLNTNTETEETEEGKEKNISDIVELENDENEPIEDLPF